MIIIHLNYYQSERSEAEYRNKIEEFIAEKNKLISEKDKALEEKDKYFEEYRKMREEKEELNRKLYEEHQLFEKILRKMQSMAMMQLIQNSGDESMKKLCLEFTKIVDSYEGPQDMPKIKERLQGFGRALDPAED